MKTEINQGVLSYLLDETIKIINLLNFDPELIAFKYCVRQNRKYTQRTSVSYQSTGTVLGKSTGSTV